jgi:hypothetical protein
VIGIYLWVTEGWEKEEDRWESEYAEVSLSDCSEKIYIYLYTGNFQLTFKKNILTFSLMSIACATVPFFLLEAHT